MGIFWRRIWLLRLCTPAGGRSCRTQPPRGVSGLIDSLMHACRSPDACVGAMELVASELKQSGAYVARTLSYEVGHGTE